MTNVWQCVKRLNGNQLVMAAIPCHTISRIKWLHKLHWMPNKNEIERYQKRARFSWSFDGVTETAGMRIEKLRKQQQQKAHTHSLHIKFYLFLLLVTLYQTCYESYLVEYCPSHSHHGRVNVLWLHRSLSLSFSWCVRICMLWMCKCTHVQWICGNWEVQERDTAHETVIVCRTGLWVHCMARSLKIHTTNKALQFGWMRWCTLTANERCR